MRTEVKNAFGRTFYTIEYNQPNNIVDAVWYGYVSKLDFKQALEAGLALMEQVRCPYRLNDNLALTGPWNELMGWLEENWLPRAMKAGVRYLAQVASKNSSGEVAGEALKISRIGREITFRSFYTREDAITWLLECQRKDLTSAVH